MSLMTEIRGVAANGAVLAGVGGGVAALTMIPNPEAKLFAGAMMFALAAGSAMRRAFFAPLDAMRAKATAMRSEPAEYPFATRNPWELGGAPMGL